MDSYWSWPAILNVLSIAMQIWGFFYVKKSAQQNKKSILGVLFISLIIFTSFNLTENIRHHNKIENTSKEIVGLLKKRTMTIDELVEQLFHPDFSVVSEALDNLIKEGKVSQQIIEVYNDQRQQFRIRGFYLTPSPA